MERMKRPTSLVLFFYIQCSFVLFSVRPSVAKSTFRLTAEIQLSQEEIFRLHFIAGDSLLLLSEKKESLNLAIPWLRCKQQFLQAFVGEDPKDYYDFKLMAADFVENADKFSLDNNDSLAGFAVAEILLFKALLHAKNSEYISSAWDLHQCHSKITWCKKQFPDYPVTAIVSGALDMVLGAVPANYEWLLHVVDMQGDIEIGRQQMLRFLQTIQGGQYECMEDEVVFALASLHASLTPDQPVNPLLMRLLKSGVVRNELIRISWAGILMKQRENDRALEVLSHPYDLSATLPLYFLDFRLGVARMRAFDKRASADLYRFLRNFKGGNYRKAAWQKLAWMRLMDGDTIGYRSCMRSCLLAGDELMDEDREAQREAQEAVVPSVFLLRARILFDGGYYRKSLDELTSIAVDFPLTTKDRLELTYRFARVLQCEGREEHAIRYYQNTLENGRNQSWYFAANSALMLGSIYEAHHDCSTARKYYAVCLSLRRHDYQNSIDQKAKAGLKRCEH